MERTATVESVAEKTWSVRPRGSDVQRSWSIEPYSLPLDLRSWVDPWQLAAWTEAEVERDVQREQTGNQLPSGLTPHRHKVMLRVLTFAYASRVFDSEGIVHKCMVDPVFRVVCDGELPVTRELWRFRREHRASLERILCRVLLRSIREKFGLDPELLHPELENDLRQRAIERLNIARHMDQC